MKLPLPIDEDLPRIRKTFQTYQNLVLSAAPGAGKTTRVPVTLLAEVSKRILMLQPRRIAARASAERIAIENGWQLGNEVGYRVRFEDVSSDQTRLLIVTEALLLRELLADPQLTRYSAVILDEFHERNLYSDIGLSALRELQRCHRPDLKIVVMSATLESKPLLDYLSPAGFENVEGQTYPVEIHYDRQSQTLNTDRHFIERMGQKIIEASQSSKPESPVLAFLPGLSEIQRLQDWLQLKSTHLQHKQIQPLHGHLSLTDQHQVLESKSPRVILATNIAETSLTIDGVNTVVDSGLARELQNDQRRLYPWLKTTRISRASAEQRKGRAGRQGPGRCFRLWTKLDEQSMPAFGAPDIYTQDLTDSLLMLIQMGVTQPLTFSWFERPPEASIQRALQLLLQLDVIKQQTEQFKLTERGQWIQAIPLNPRLASLVFEGHQQNQLSLAISIACLLNEKDPWARQDVDSWVSEAQDSDLIPRLHEMRKGSSRDFFLASKASRQLHSLLKVAPVLSSTSPSASQLARLLLRPFLDRLARRRRPKERSGLAVGTKGVELSQRSLVRDSEFFLCLSGHANESNGNAIVDLAHPISKQFLFLNLGDEITTQTTTSYIENKNQWIQSEQKAWRDLPLEEPTLKPLNLTPEVLHQMATSAFSQWKTTDEALEQLYRRLDWAQILWPHEPWPPISLWEEECIEMACLGEKQLQTIREKNWEELFLLALPPRMQKLLTQDLPKQIKAPNGRHFQLRYEGYSLVNLELKIQDAFGWKATPTIAQGQIKVRLSLLGPHKRPLQTTDDLASFWSGTYQELRPQLKARYPKHSWPEDPTL